MKTSKILVLIISFGNVEEFSLFNQSIFNVHKSRNLSHITQISQNMKILFKTVNFLNVLTSFSLIKKLWALSSINICKYMYRKTKKQAITV